MKMRALAYACLLVVIICCGGLTVGSSNLEQRRGEVTAVVDGDRPGTVLAHTRWGDEPWSWLVGDDGELLNWSGATSSSEAAPRVQQCVNATCYRAATTALRVEASEDGGVTYTTAWEIAGEEYAMLADSYSAGGILSSRSLVVHPVAGGHVVFVANGRDGLLYRDVDGAWHRLGFPSSGEGCCFYESALPLRSNPELVWLTVVAITVAVVATLLPAALIARKRRNWRRTTIAGVVVVAALAGYGGALAVRFPDVGMFPGAFYGVPTLFVVVVVGASLGALFASLP